MIELFHSVIVLQEIDDIYIFFPQGTWKTTKTIRILN